MRMAFLFSCMLLISCVHAQTFQNGVSLDSKTVTRQQKYLGWNLDDLNPDNKTRSIAYTNMGEGNVYYFLTRSNVIGVASVETKAYLGSWPIDAFEDPSLEDEINIFYENYGIVDDRLAALPVEQTGGFPSGCFNRNPLRYGDLTGDQKTELVIFALNEYGALNISIFSSDTKKIIFQYRAITNDAIKNYRIEQDQEHTFGEGYPLADKPTSGQYLSYIAEDNTRMAIGIDNAIIQFAKIYLEDFDADEKTDLIAWRKLYKTRELQDPIKGFQKIRDTYIHYKLIDGEYKKQPTSSDTIKGWLAEKNLTWQKGYPSKSECPGQEEQLIPEMHDPLLNDPDVLIGLQ